MEWNEMKSNDKIKYNNQVKNITIDRGLNVKL